MTTNNLIESVKDGIVGTIKGTGEILNAVTDTVSQTRMSLIPVATCGDGKDGS